MTGIFFRCDSMIPSVDLETSLGCDSYYFFHYSFPTVWAGIRFSLHLLTNIRQALKDGNINLIMVFLGLHQPLIEASHGFGKHQGSDLLSSTIKFCGSIFFLPERVLTFVHSDHLVLTVLWFVEVIGRFDVLATTNVQGKNDNY